MLTAFTDFLRLIKIAWVLARHDALIPHEFAPMVPGSVRLVGKIMRLGTRTKGQRPGERLAKALAGLGPAYVKFGQVLATRPDVVGRQMADDLRALQDRMAPFPTDMAKAEIERSLGQPAEALFSQFSDAVAAASIAQVHKAETHDGRMVAVKVLRPGIEQKTRKEFRVLLLGAKMAQGLVPSARRLEPVKFIKTLTEASALELDLRIEAGSASELRENLASFEDIVVPQVDWQHSSRRVLTLEWISGTPLSDINAVAAAGHNRPYLAVLVMRSFLTQALEYGFFHADMHQGNLFVDENGRLVLIDFGIMGRLDEMARRVFAEIILGFIRRDYRAAAKAHFDAGYVPPHFNVEAFATALRAVGEPIFNKRADELDMSRVMQQLFDVTDVFDMHLRPELVLLQRTMVVVEGVARILDPKIDLWSTAEPVVRSYLEREVGLKAFARKAKANAEAAVSLIDAFPEFAQAAEAMAGQLSNGGLKLSDDTITRLARALKGKSLHDDQPGEAGNS
ncbi:MAG: 2-polyprenylphenol 6-hydroxylase [Pseudomonadota bacterium]